MRRTRAQARASLDEPLAASKRQRAASTTRAAAATVSVPKNPVKRAKKEAPKAATLVEESGGSDADEGNAMNEYERKRLENIQRNLEFMKSMGVSTAKIAARTAQKPLTPVTKSVTSSASSHTKKPSAPTRRSGRIQGQDAPAIEVGTDNKIKVVVPEPRRSMRNAPADLSALVAAQPNILSEEDHKTLLESLTRVVEDESEGESERDLQVDASGVTTVQYQLDANDIVKAVSERIYSLAFHPRKDRVVLACGDKRGELCLWSTSATHPASEPTDNVVAAYRPHKSPITGMHFSKADDNKLLSSSYDCCIREFDIPSGKFTDLFTAPDDQGLTSMIVDPHHENRLMLSTDTGHVWLVDPRQDQGKANQQAYHLHEKKVNTVDVHPSNEFCIATASLDRTAMLWDIRQLKKTGSKPLLTMPHDRSVNCASFSPNGQHVVTVCLNDYVCVYDPNVNTHEDATNVQPTLAIPHNNQTGRWLTKLYTSWNPRRDDEFIIGCMQQPRRLQIFKATRKNPIQELRSEYFNSVHSINVFHPTLDLIAGGNSSGRVCLWRAKRR